VKIARTGAVGRLSVRAGAVSTLSVVALVFVTSASGAEPAPDPQFGTGGFAAYAMGFNTTSTSSGGFSEFRAVGEAPDGTILAAGVSGDAVEQFNLLAARVLDDGVLDDSFAGTGWVHNIALPEQFPAESADALAIEPGDGLVLAGDGIERLTPAGTEDGSFASREDTGIRGLDRLPNGDLAAVGHVNSHVAPEEAALIEALSLDGSRDPSFGSGGLVEPPQPAGHTGVMETRSIVTLPDGDLLASGNGDSRSTEPNTPGHRFLWLARMTANGVLDPTYGEDGVLYIAGLGPGLLAARSGGYVLLGATIGPVHEGELPTAWGLGEEGAVDNAFGADGVTAASPAYGYDNAEPIALAPEPAGGVLLLARQGNNENPAGTIPPPIRPSVTRLTADGSIDSGFGEKGTWLGLPSSKMYALTEDGRGRILLAGSLEEDLDEGHTRVRAALERLLTAPTAGVPVVPPSGSGEKRVETHVASLTANAEMLLARAITRCAGGTTARVATSKRGCRIALRLPTAGTLSVAWSMRVRRGARRSLLAHAKATVIAGRDTLLRLTLTREGVRTLRRLRRNLRLLATAELTAKPKTRPLRTTVTFKLTR
jgi:uncharacterized delta-60 repeat protein